MGELITCSAIAAATGVRCRKRPMDGAETCKMHSAQRMAEGPLTVPRCTASSRSRGGERCKYPAVPGTNVCRFHGGSTKHVKQKAALRLATLVDPAIGTLAREMVKAERSADRQRAANSILDRAGIVRKQDGEADTARLLLVERLRALREQAAGGELEILEAEVIDD